MVSWRTGRIIFFCLLLMAGVLVMTALTNLNGLLAVTIRSGATSPAAPIPSAVPTPTPVETDPITPLPRFPHLSIAVPQQSVWAPLNESAEAAAADLDYRSGDVLGSALCPVTATWCP